MGAAPGPSAKLTTPPCILVVVEADEEELAADDGVDPQAARSRAAEIGAAKATDFLLNFLWLTFGTFLEHSSLSVKAQLLVVRLVGLLQRASKYLVCF